LPIKIKTSSPMAESAREPRQRPPRRQECRRSLLPIPPNRVRPGARLKAVAHDLRRRALRRQMRCDAYAGSRFS
jgi:hypothetical protein